VDADSAPTIVAAHPRKEEAIKVAESQTGEIHEQRKDRGAGDNDERQKSGRVLNERGMESQHKGDGEQSASPDESREEWATSHHGWLPNGHAEPRALGRQCSTAALRRPFHEGRPPAKPAKAARRPRCPRTRPGGSSGWLGRVFR
jgi:hypothetical protein